MRNRGGKKKRRQRGEGRRRYIVKIFIHGGTADRGFDTGSKSRRSAEGGGGGSKGGRSPTSRGAAQSGDGTTSGGSASTGGGQETEGNQQGMSVDGVGAAGRDAGTGTGHYGHTRRWSTGTINSGSGADAEGV